MTNASYQQRRSQLAEYFDRTAATAWQRLTSDAPVSRIRATVREGRAQMRNTLLDWIPADLTGRRLLDAGCGTGMLAVEAARRGWLSEPLVVAGSFSGMDSERGVEMTWMPARSQYEGSVLLKQGKYQYFYSSSDPRFQETVRRSQSRYESTFTTLVYYNDPSKGTDRLLRMSSFRR